jgi:chaperonin GroEL (HSP60 family)
LRGSSPELVQELERTLRNAVLILKHSLTNPRVVPGGGAVYMHVSSRLRQVALSYPSREQLAIDAFANALEQIPGTLARNYGLDEIDALAELRRMHSEGESWTGVTESGCTNVESKVVELASVSKAALRRACEIAILLLRIDHYLYVRDLPLVHKQ